jgi:hypothetical protein
VLDFQEVSEMNLEECVTNPLWPILVETVHAMVMYPHHKGYVRSTILLEQPDVNAQELSVKMGIPLGEGLVILHELLEEQKKQN